MRYQRAVEIALGFGAGTSLEPLGREWFEAFCFLEEEVDELMYRVNSKRSDEKVRATMRRMF